MSVTTRSKRGLRGVRSRPSRYQLRVYRSRNNAKPFCPQDPLQNGLRREERRVLKLSDCFTRRGMRKLDLYHCVWKPLGIDDSLRVWFPAPPGRARTMYLERGKRDFSERDRSLLELLRPFLIRIARRADRRRQGDVRALLTLREVEILQWIGRGKTTREIAAVLVVSPHTVRKPGACLARTFPAPGRRPTRTPCACARAGPHSAPQAVEPKPGRRLPRDTTRSGHRQRSRSASAGGREDDVGATIDLRVRDLLATRASPSMTASQP